MAGLLSVWESGGRSASDFEELCAQHPSIADELRSRAAALAQFESAIGPVGQLAIRGARPQVAGYAIQGFLGEGGMGTVWEAVHVATNRRVALKLLPAHHLVSAKARARFEREVELASRLEHSNIARLYDSGRGSGPDRDGGAEGAFYFSMELIEGVPIDRFEFGSLREKITTLIMTARALAHAHTRAVIHRDLKPTNLLITPDRQPHLLDFGLARDMATDSLLTLESPFAGSPGYCSPEQARGEPTDTRGDLFSLGVIAVQVITGRHPYDLKMPPQQLVYHIATTPVDLSAMTTLPADLGLILRKCTAFVAAERYGSADSFADDLEAFLQSRPVSVRRPTLAYSAGKYLARHRQGVMVTGAVLLLATAAGGFFSLRLLTERTKAAHSAQIAAEANAFLSDLLKASDPEVGQGSVLTVAAVLDRAAVRIESRKDLSPEVEAAIRTSLGAAYDSLDTHAADAEAQFRRAATVLEKAVGAQDRETLTARRGLAAHLSGCGKGEEAIALMRVLDAHCAKYLGPDDILTLRVGFDLCVALGTFDHTEEFVRFAPGLMAHLSSRLAKDQPTGLTVKDLDVLRVMYANATATPANADARTAEAANVMGRIVEYTRAQYGPEDFHTARALLNHGIALRLARSLTRSESVLRESVRLRQRIYGLNHSDTLYAQFNLALTLRDEGVTDQHKSVEAAQSLEGLIEKAKACPTPPHFLPEALAALADIQPRQTPTRP